ncbi:MAG: hypothetical protein JWQ87_5402 [Candidatus Sulfotelmatobacter sp.]|nr:hypothetical protein [Candidatus Sulfotelmatobacter sp.]
MKTHSFPTRSQEEVKAVLDITREALNPDVRDEITGSEWFQFLHPGEPEEREE